MQTLKSLDSSERLYCRNCAESLDLAEVGGFKAHLLDTSACFFHYTQEYWACTGSPNDNCKCNMCNQELHSELDLRQHCIKKTGCRLKYIELLTSDTSWKDMVLVDQTKKDVQGEQQSILQEDNIILVEDCPAAKADLGKKVLLELRCCNKTFLSLKSYRNQKTKFHKESTDESSSSDVDSSDVDSSDVDSSDVDSSDDAHGNVADCSPCGQGKNSRRHEGGSTKSTRNTQIQATPAHPSRSRARLRPRRLKNCCSCPACDKQFTSEDVLKEHRAASEKCQEINRFFAGISCIKCRTMFPEENEKLTHIINTSACESFLKTAFEKGEFFESAEFYDSMGSNPSMCYYCKAEDGEVFHHLVFVTPCLKIFEKAILKHKLAIATESVSSLSPVGEEVQFECDICKKRFHKESTLKTHKTKLHSGDAASTRKRVSSEIASSEHVFCFKCRKYLRSVTEVEKHCSNCPSKKLLSRYCREKAVWEEGAYQCKICTANNSQDREQHFHSISALKNHMHSHDKGRSRLLSISFTHIAIEHNYASTSSTKANQSNSTEREKRLELFCARCGQYFNSGRLFKEHILEEEECLNYYDHPRDKCWVGNEGCYVCNRKS